MNELASRRGNFFNRLVFSLLISLAGLALLGQLAAWAGGLDAVRSDPAALHGAGAAPAHEPRE